MGEYSYLIKVIFSGIIQGGFYALLTVGVSLIFSVTRVINLPHGDMVILCSYIAYHMFTSFGWDPILSIILVVPASAIMGKLMELGYKKVFKTSEWQSLVLAFGFSYLFQNTMVGAFGASYTALIIPKYEAVIKMGPVVTSTGRLVTFIISIGVLGLLALFFRRTNLGRAMRAIYQDEETSIFMGVNLSRVYTLTFLMGCGLAGLVGSIYIFLQPIYPWNGLDLIIKGITIMILAGIGSLKGIFLAGCIIGICESLGIFYLGGMLGDVVAYTILIVILLVRPTGLFSR